jgi:branched-chain amino acid transport system ATP-binding protein
MLTIENLHVRYGTTHAVRAVSLTVPGAETVALLGPNSAGKSSILNAVSGLNPYEGRITFDGKDLAGMPPEKRARAGLIQVPEGRRMIGTLTVHENLLLGMTAQAGRKPVFGLEDVYALFPMLADMTNRPSWTLSGGQQQMVAVGRALVAAPRLLMLDEPSLGLSPLVVKEVFNALRKISVEVPLLLVEQNSNAALDLCTAVTVIRNGRSVFQGTPERARAGDVLHRAYLGHDGEDDDVPDAPTAATTNYRGSADV